MNSVMVDPLANDHAGKPDRRGRLGGNHTLDALTFMKSGVVARIDRTQVHAELAVVDRDELVDAIAASDPDRHGADEAMRFARAGGVAKHDLLRRVRALDA